MKFQHTILLYDISTIGVRDDEQKIVLTQSVFFFSIYLIVIFFFKIYFKNTFSFEIKINEIHYFFA